MKFRYETLLEYVDGDDIGFEGLKFVQTGEWKYHRKFLSRESIFTYGGNYYSFYEELDPNEGLIKPEDNLVFCQQVWPTIEYKKTYSNTPKSVIVVECEDERDKRFWLDSDEFRIMSEAGCKIIS